MDQPHTLPRPQAANRPDMGFGPNLRSQRAAQARFALLLAKPWLRGLLIIGVLALVLLGWLLLIGKQPVGWVLMGFAPLPLMPLVWYAWWLSDLPTAKNGHTVDDLLEGPLLGTLFANASPQQVAELVMRRPGGQFFAMRFGVGPNFLSQLSSQNSADSQMLWQTTLQLRDDLHHPSISSAIVVAALVQMLPNRDQMLAQLQLTYDDVLAGVHWQARIKELAAISRSRSAGGLGRDLSFGYTPLLSRFAYNISLEAAKGVLAREVQSHKLVIDQLVSQLASDGRRNAAIVGQPGVGKTTVVWALAERLYNGDPTLPRNLRYCQVMALDSSVLISSAKGRGDLEGLVSALLEEAFKAKNVILFFDNAELFFSDGTGSVDLRNILLPVLEAGRLRIILSMDEQQYLRLTHATPSVAQQLNRLTVLPSQEVETLMVCEDQVLVYESHFRVTYMYQAMRMAYRLGQRYVTGQAMPGQALKLLEASAQYAQNQIVTASSIEQAVERIFGVKVANAQQGDESKTLLNLEQLLHERMINQSRAVAVVANALRRARSGVRNQNRPIGSFLFLGPTGVGKTELAKALASVYFGGEDNIVRVDLNEYGEATDAARLIADGAHDPNSLVAKITKQPSSVVLLDEIEKAHPNVLNTLLQLLDEGILRDATNREVSFRDAIVIATSNAGADKIRKYIQEGKQPDQFEREFIDGLIDTNQFRPEFMNRFDETVVFRPLTSQELLQVVDLMLAGVNKTLQQRHIQVQVAQEAKAKLVEVGNDPRLGARPLRRVVQRTVENIVAKRLLAGDIAPGTAVAISLVEVNEALQQ